MKPLRQVKPNPKDPDWTFPYAKRSTMEKILIYFENLPYRKEGWKGGLRTAPKFPDSEGTRWPTVPPQHRQKVEDWFQMMLARTKRERGEVTQHKLRSLMGNAANYGRYVLTGKRRANHGAYARRKRLLEAYREWQHREELARAPKLRARNVMVA
jgi:hypothetical protein